MRPAIFLLFSLSLSLENLRASTKETEGKPSSRKIINQVSTKQDESHWSRFQLSSCSRSLNSNTHFGWMTKMAIKKQMIFPTNLSNRWILSSKKKKQTSDLCSTKLLLDRSSHFWSNHNISTQLFRLQILIDDK